MRILVVDDSVVMRNALNVFLKEYGLCDNAPNGEIAFLLFKEAHASGCPYHLVTMDVEMPIMKGPDVVQRMREHEASLRIKPGEEARILMSTSANTIETVSSAYSKGCDGYILKPPTREKIDIALAKLGIQQKA